MKNSIKMTMLLMLAFSLVSAGLLKADSIILKHNISAKIHTYNFFANDTIGDLKDKLSKKFDVSSDKIIFFYGGRKISDETKITETEAYKVESPIIYQVLGQKAPKPPTELDKEKESVVDSLNAIQKKILDSKKLLQRLAQSRDSGVKSLSANVMPLMNEFGERIRSTIELLKFLE